MGTVSHLASPVPAVRSWILCLFFVAGALVAGISVAADTTPSGSALQEKYQAIADQIHNSPFRKPIYFESTQHDDRVEGEIYALIDHAYADVAEALSKVENWCAILMLHPNTKHCDASPSQSSARITMYVGRKHYQPLDQASKVDFNFRLDAYQATYFRAILTASDGPVGTRDYRILLEVAPLADGRSLLHFSYGYSYDFLGRIAMKSYLTTLGRDKIGFTVVGRDEQGKVRYVQGIRGVGERNTMRYYLAIESFLNTLDVPIGERLERRLHAWFSASEVYAEQLHEMERAEYLEMKLKEHQRLELVEDGGR